ncbi:MAG: YdcF family protein [Gammaproteobacteria bacterium]|nr:YdcF family protein [Gammaproteobacteria bacterium]
MIENIFRYFLMPSNLITILFLISFLAILTKRLLKVAKISLFIGMFLYFIFGSGPVSFWLMKQLEYQYPSLSQANISSEVKHIVVLAGFAENISSRSITANIYPASAYRVLEAARLYNSSPETLKIIITGEGEAVQLMSQVLVSLGVSTSKILIDNNSKNTADSAVYISELLNQQSFYLVTSAGHMPRAVAAFDRMKLSYIPSPTHYMSKENILATAYLPTPRHLYISDMAISEYLARFNDYLTYHFNN